MTDPLDALRDPIRPVAPDPAFARALRTRLERALLDIPEEPVTATLETGSDVRLHSLTPYLAVLDARAAVAFYVDAFGARRRDEPIVMPDGRVGHVEVTLGDSVLMMADEYPEMGLLAPRTRGGPSQSLRLEVPDPDAVVAAAVAAGARLERPVTDSPYGRGGTVVDPSGHRWMVSREAPVVRPGDVVYASLWTVDAERARRFYTAALGWSVSGGADGELHVDGGPGLGISGGQPRATTMLCYRVSDVDAAVVLVRAAGGTAGDPEDRPYGRVADGVDDQGIPFALVAGDAAAGGPAAAGLTYVEFRVPDAGRARAFYGTVLGWGFEPGAEEGYWHPTVAGGGFPSPMAGLVGGHAEASVVPGFGVPDTAAALAAVRASGGTADGPVGGDHDTGSPCTDDQGAPFALVRR